VLVRSGQILWVKVRWSWLLTFVFIYLAHTHNDVFAWYGYTNIPCLHTKVCLLCQNARAVVLRVFTFSLGRSTLTCCGPVAPVA
jgi:hypothetical protein